MDNNQTYIWGLVRNQYVHGMDYEPVFWAREFCCSSSEFLPMDQIANIFLIHEN